MEPELLEKTNDIIDFALNNSKTTSELILFLFSFAIIILIIMTMAMVFVKLKNSYKVKFLKVKEEELKLYSYQVSSLIENIATLIELFSNELDLHFKIEHKITESMSKIEHKMNSHISKHDFLCVVNLKIGQDDKFVVSVIKRVCSDIDGLINLNKTFSMGDDMYTEMSISVVEIIKEEWEVVNRTLTGLVIKDELRKDFLGILYEAIIYLNDATKIISNFILKNNILSEKENFKTFLKNKLLVFSHGARETIIKFATDKMS